MNTFFLIVLGQIISLFGNAACSGRNADRRRAGRPLP